MTIKQRNSIRKAEHDAYRFGIHDELDAAHEAGDDDLAFDLEMELDEVME